MNILLVGSGGREHALAWKILQSPRLSQLYVTATTPLISNPKITSIPIKEQDIADLVNFAQQKNVELVVIGGEAPLAAGLSDALRQANIRVFGPSKIAAQIETSKVFAKNFMARHRIPTARYATFTDFANALAYVKNLSYPYVIKASGLAAGKGVFLPDTLQETETILKEILQDKSLGNAGTEIVIEERLQGDEISLLAFTDGITLKLMPPARDHKRLLEGDTGPNTGGMGAFAPVPLPHLITIDSLTKTILQPTIDGLRMDGQPFVGVLYAGLMLTADGPRVLEFNCRFGDPETQVLLPLLETDLVEVLTACTDQELASCEIRWHSKTAACVVLASEGYPVQSKTDRIITGLESNHENTAIFHAGTRRQDEHIYTAGGRVLGVTGLGNSLDDALKIAYERIASIHFEGMQFRKDIGQNQTRIKK